MKRFVRQLIMILVLSIGLSLNGNVWGQDLTKFSSKTCNYVGDPSAVTTSWQSVSGSLSSNYYNRYDFYLTSGRKYTFSLCSNDGGSSAFDSYMGLFGYGYGCYSTDLSCLAYNDDGCGTASKFIYTATQTGWTSLYITGYSAGASGSYTLQYMYEIPVTTPSPYCTPVLTSSTTSYYISNFTTTGGTSNINNTTSGSGSSYSNFYNTYSLISSPGATINFTITIAGGGTHGSAIWIDWNNDGDFEDTDERVYATTSYTSSPHTSSFTIPSNISSGNYIMRVVSDFLGSNPSNPCSASTGEFEDYKLIINSKYTVTYNANGGTGTMDDANSPYNSGNTVTVLSSIFTPPTGKIFSKWNTASDGSGTDYNPGATFTINSNITLYAQWIDKPIILENCESFEDNNIPVGWQQNGTYTWRTQTGYYSNSPSAIHGNYCIYT